MNVALVTIAFNGYGKFLNQWLAFVSSMDEIPSEVIVMLGQSHGVDDIDLLKSILPQVQIYEYKRKASFGKLRNLAIKKTTTDWVWFVSVDDKPHKDALETFREVAQDSTDYICAQWNSIGLGNAQMLHSSPTPQELSQRLQNGEGGGFIIPHSPFKRWLWEAHPYKNTDLPNYDFLLHCVLNGAEFVKSNNPTTTYLRRKDSHARTKLKGKLLLQARQQKRKMQKGIQSHYG